MKNNNNKYFLKRILQQRGGIKPLLTVFKPNTKNLRTGIASKSLINNGGIYVWVNQQNGNFYVGQAKNFMERGIKYNSKSHRSTVNSLIYKAIEKYEISNFQKINYYYYIQMMTQSEQSGDRLSSRIKCS